MPDRLDVFLCGGDRPSGEVDATGVVAHLDRIATPLRQATADDLNRSVVETGSEFVCFTDRINAAAFTRAVEELESHVDAVAAISFEGIDPIWETTWRQLPTSLAVLTAPPETRSVVVFRRSAIERLGEFRPVSSPIWEWLVRATSHGAELPIASTETEEDDRSHRLDLPVLAPQAPDAGKDWLLSHLANLDPAELLTSVTSPTDAVAVKAGLFQLHDALDESHQLSQSVEGRGRNRAGDYWHAIMHRREPDYSNSKYWFRRVGQHPAFDELARIAADVLDRDDDATFGEWRKRLKVPDDWDSFAFVDLCQECARTTNRRLLNAAQSIQWTEMHLLLQQTVVDATA